jgi:drug/metabolite transporter (DMT)-like permease
MLAAPFLFVVLWSSSFIAAKAGLRHLSPLLFVAIRLVACAVVLVALMLLLRQSWRPLAGWKWLHCAIAGVLLNAIGLMAPHVGLLTAPAAQVALVQSLTPLLTAVFGMMLLRERLRVGQGLGSALGLAGVALVVGEAAMESTARLEGLVLAFVGVLGLVAGTIYFGRFCRGVSLLPGATAQFLSAAAFASLGAWLLEVPHADWTESAIAAVAWNTVMVSLGGMGLYFVMLVRGHRRTRQCELLSRPRRRGGTRLAAPRRATGPLRLNRISYGICRMLAGQCTARRANAALVLARCKGKTDLPQKISQLPKLLSRQKRITFQKAAWVEARCDSSIERLGNVRFNPTSDQRTDIAECLKCASLGSRRDP